MLSNYPSGSDNEYSPWNEDDPVMVSNCCGYPVYGNTDICTACLEHCKIIEEGSE